MPQSDIIALININSGNKLGLNILKLIKNKYKYYAFDIFDISDELLLEKITKKSRIIIGGGDGTISYALSMLKKLNIDNPIAILPLGCGNELAHSIGWSKKYNKKNLTKYMNFIHGNNISDIDIWNIKYNDIDIYNENNLYNNNRNKIMASFLSIGFDANICQQFHVIRQNMKKDFSIFKSHLLYIKLGFKELFNSSEFVNNYIDLYVDNIKINLKNIRSLQILNINSMARYVDFFGTGKSNKNDIIKDYTKPKFNDNLLEIVGTKSISKMMKLRMKISHAQRIAQGKKIVIIFKKSLPIQIDGEGWINPETTIEISLLKKQKIICGPW